MTCFDYDDLKARLLLLGFTEDNLVHQSILKLAAVLDNDVLTDIERELVLTLFSLTALEQINSLPEELLSQTKWQPFDYGNVRKGEFVRVRLNAYDSKTGIKHNGRLGILMDVYARRCKVKYIGIPAADIQPHPIENLESLQKVYNKDSNSEEKII